MFKEIFLESNKTSQLIRDLLDLKINPKDYNKRVKEVERTNKNWYKRLPSQGGVNYINLANYESFYDKEK
jgi:hypothetical protein